MFLVVFSIFISWQSFIERKIYPAHQKGNAWRFHQCIQPSPCFLNLVLFGSLAMQGTHRPVISQQSNLRRHERHAILQYRQCPPLQQRQTTTPACRKAPQPPNQSHQNHFTINAALGTNPASFSVKPKSLWSKTFFGKFCVKLSACTPLS